MADVETWMHLLGLSIIILIFVVSIQQICISSIKQERPKSIYRILTCVMLMNEVLQHLLCSLWFEATANGVENKESDTVVAMLHFSRFLTAMYVICNLFFFSC